MRESKQAASAPPSDHAVLPLCLQCAAEGIRRDLPNSTQLSVEEKKLVGLRLGMCPHHKLGPHQVQPQLCKSCITTGLPLQQVQQISCLYKQNPAKDSLAPDPAPAHPQQLSWILPRPEELQQEQFKESGGAETAPPGPTLELETKDRIIGNELFMEKLILICITDTKQDGA
ncbi:hypothetical protein TURU_015979 [Turdus rufiventris]|nr:hypothetical protein TURU_015979 [Turdus rufiventris]